MQEFRRPEWMAYLSLSEKVMTDLSEQDLSFLVSALSEKEAFALFVLNPALDQWVPYVLKKDLHKPFSIQRGVSCPDLTKIKTQVQSQSQSQGSTQSTRAGQISEASSGEYWCLLNNKTKALLTEMSLVETLLVISGMTPSETQSLYSAKNGRNWTLLAAEKELHKPLQLSRGLKAPALPMPNSAGKTGVPRNIGEAELVGGNWKSKIIQVRWPDLYFSDSVLTPNEFFNLEVVMFGGRFQLMCTKNSDSLKKGPHVVQILPSVGAQKLQEFLSHLVKSPKEKSQHAPSPRNPAKR